MKTKGNKPQKLFNKIVVNRHTGNRVDVVEAFPLDRALSSAFTAPNVAASLKLTTLRLFQNKGRQSLNTSALDSQFKGAPNKAAGSNITNKLFIKNYGVK